MMTLRKTLGNQMTGSGNQIPVPKHQTYVTLEKGKILLAQQSKWRWEIFTQKSKKNFIPVPSSVPPNCWGCTVPPLSSHVPRMPQQLRASFVPVTPSERLCPTAEQHLPLCFPPPAHSVGLCQFTQTGPPLQSLAHHTPRHTWGPWVPLSLCLSEGHQAGEKTRGWNMKEKEVLML